MYIKKQVLVELYQEFMDRMDDDLKVTDDFNGPLTDDYLEGIRSGLTVSQNIFRECYKQACRK
jgi:hypothetical protein